MCAICTWVSPYMDWILFPPKLRQVRAVKFIWAISFRIVALWFSSVSCITYIASVISLRIEWFAWLADWFLPSTSHSMNKIGPYIPTQNVLEKDGVSLYVIILSTIFISFWSESRDGSCLLLTHQKSIRTAPKSEVLIQVN